MLIAVINKSTLVKNSDVDLMCQAIQIQADLHFLPAWNMKAATIKFYADPTKVPGYSWKIYMIDSDTSVPDALGYHQEENSGQIDGYIMCAPVLSNGGAVLKYDPKKPGSYTVSGTLSHEILEVIWDRYANSFSDNGGVSFCNEVCDAVEMISYGISVGGTEVSVSDFVFPSFFNPDATYPMNAPFNYLNTLRKPFTILAGGYAITRTGGPGTETQTFGEAMPEWRRVQKSSSFSRKNRRK